MPIVVDELRLDLVPASIETASYSYRTHSSGRADRKLTSDTVTLHSLATLQHALGRLLDGRVEVLDVRLRRVRPEHVRLLQ